MSAEIEAEIGALLADEIPKVEHAQFFAFTSMRDQRDEALVRCDELADQLDVARRFAESFESEIAKVRHLHRPVEWWRCGDDGTAGLSDPLGSFCAECTDEDYVAAIENGDGQLVITAVVPWPCRTAEAVYLPAEVRGALHKEAQR